MNPETIVFLVVKDFFFRFRSSPINEQIILTFLSFITSFRPNLSSTTAPVSLPISPPSPLLHHARSHSHDSSWSCCSFIVVNHGSSNRFRCVCSVRHVVERRYQKFCTNHHYGCFGYLYGLIVAVILSNQMHGGTTDLTSADGYRNFTAGLAVGFTMPGEQLGHLFVYDVSPDKKFGCLERQPLHHEVCRRRKKSRRQHTHSMMTCTLHHFREISFFLLLLQTRWGAWYPRLKIQKRF